MGKRSGCRLAAVHVVCKKSESENVSVCEEEHVRVTNVQNSEEYQGKSVKNQLPLYFFFYPLPMFNPSTVCQRTYVRVAESYVNVTIKINFFLNKI